MTRFANRKHICGTAAAASLAVCLALAVVAGEAFADSANQAPAAPGAAPSAAGAPASGAPTATAPTMPQQSTPAFRPGFLHQLKTWWDDSVAVFDRKDANQRDTASDTNKKTEDNSPGMAGKAKDAAASAMTTTRDAMKNAVEATRGAASSAVEATKGAASNGHRRDERRGGGNQERRDCHRAAAEHPRDSSERGLRACAEPRFRLRGGGSKWLSPQRL